MYIYIYIHLSNMYTHMYIYTLGYMCACKYPVWRVAANSDFVSVTISPEDNDMRVHIAVAGGCQKLNHGSYVTHEAHGAGLAVQLLTQQ